MQKEEETRVSAAFLNRDQLQTPREDDENEMNTPRSNIPVKKAAVKK